MKMLKLSMMIPPTFISYLSDLLAKSKPFDAAVKKLHDLIDQIAAATGHDSTDVFRALLVKLIEQPEEQQTLNDCWKRQKSCRKIRIKIKWIP